VTLPKVPGDPAPTSRSVRAASRAPNWLGSIRFRIALLYTVFLFGLATIVVGAIYLGISRSLDGTVYSVYVGQPVPGGVVVQRQDFQTIEQVVNQRTLDTLRRYTFGSLSVLFVASFGVGWLVAGRVLKPIGRITEVAREIQATDLSRRIDLGGPDDELRQLADTFDAMLGRIDDAFESQREFIHEASHELRNPLAVIRTNLDVTLADPDASADELRHTAEIVQKSTERMGRLVDDLLVYARKGTLSLETAPLDAADVVHEAADEFALSAQERGLTIQAVAPPHLWVVGDRLALRQALGNLLANAIRVSDEGTSIRVSAGRHESWVWLAVEDQGPGIPPRDRERVFQRFYRGDAEPAAGTARSGLGLTIVRQIAEAHGGEVRLVSEEGRGSAFAVWIPAAAEPFPASTPPTAVVETPAPNAASPDGAATPSSPASSATG
jgi:signal transduction histidine kinase